MMQPYFQVTPSAPAFTLAWDELRRAFSWLRALDDCPQDAVHHAEGDVGIHTRLVCEWLCQSAEWRSLDESGQRVTFWAALLHDVAKPATTRTEDDGRITARGHSRRGEIMARNLLYGLNAPFAEREQITAIIHSHQFPFFLIERTDAQRKLYEISQTAHCGYLALVAEADMRGRICQDQQRLLDNIELFREMARNADCFTQPYQFPSAHSRFLYFRKPERDATYHAFDDTVCQAVLMCGLPGAGKSTWAQVNLPDWPQVCLDDIRQELGVSPADNQGTVMQTARERTREFLRRRQNFVWNATSLLRLHRDQIIDIFAAYNARTRIVYIEVPETLLFQQNANREKVVPAAVIRAMMDKWEMPDATEVHQIDYQIGVK